MMKKIIMVFIIFFLFIFNVYAEDITVSMSGTSNIDQNGTFDIDVYLNGNNVWGFNCHLNYDKNKLELLSSTGQNGFTATVGDNIVLDSISGHNGNFKAVTLKFRGTGNFGGGDNTTISLTNGKGATDSSLLTATNASKQITVNIPKSGNNDLKSISINGNNLSNFTSGNTSYSLGDTNDSTININAEASDSKAKISGIGTYNINYGNNTFTISVTAENGSIKKYNITINRIDNRSSNNNLSSLSITDGKINFNKNTTNYSIIVENKVTNITINANVEDSKSTITGIGSKNLEVYANTFYIVVTAENGSKKTYTIKVNRKDSDGNVGELSKDNDLKSLDVSGYELSPTFNKDILEYNLEVDNTIESVNINAVANDDNAVVVVNNSKLVIGLNKLTITITSESGDKKTYVINVNRKDDVEEVPLDKVLETISKTTSSYVKTRIDNNSYKITKDILNELKNKKKDLEINYYSDNNILLYSWIIKGNNIKNNIEINPLINFKFNSEIDKFINYPDAMYLNFEHNGKLPKNTIIKIYVGDKYKENDSINVYYYGEKKLELVKSKTIVKNGYIEFNINHCSSYILTKSIINNNMNNSLIILIIVESIIILLTLSYFIYIKYTKNKKII